MNQFRVFAYLRASTDTQDANRARKSLNDFASSKNITISAWFSENQSGASLKRPELFRLLDIANANDAILIEQVDRISRLNQIDWLRLKSILTEKRIRIIALDLPSSQTLLPNSDEFTSRMLDAINSMLLDMLAAIARKDYEDRRRRTQQGIEHAKKLGKYKGRKPDTQKTEMIKKLLATENTSYSDIQRLVGCSRGTIAKVKKSMLASLS